MNPSERGAARRLAGEAKARARSALRLDALSAGRDLELSAVAAKVPALSDALLSALSWGEGQQEQRRKLRAALGPYVSAVRSGEGESTRMVELLEEAYGVKEDG